MAFKIMTLSIKIKKSRLTQTDGKRLIFEIPTPQQVKYSKYHQINQEVIFMNIEFTDFMNLEDVAIQLDGVLNLLSILGENVFCDNNFKLPPYLAQFISVNDAAISQIQKHQETIQNIFDVLYTKFKSQEQECTENDLRDITNAMKADVKQRRKVDAANG